jgi:cell division protein FtsL
MFRKELLVSALITITLMITGIYLLKNNSYSMEGNIDKLSKEILSSQSLVLVRSIKKHYIGEKMSYKT